MHASSFGLSDNASGANGSCFAPVPRGVRARLRVTPKAVRNGIEGPRTEAGGRVALVVRVTAAPERGKANAAVIKLLAQAWGVPRSSIDITAGTTDRCKTVRIAGDSEALLRRLRDWEKTTHG